MEGSKVLGKEASFQRIGKLVQGKKSRVNESIILQLLPNVKWKKKRKARETDWQEARGSLFNKGSGNKRKKAVCGKRGVYS